MEYGKLQLLKHKKYLLVLVTFGLLILMLFNSCTSAKNITLVDFFTLFDENADIYISVPINENEILFESILNKFLVSDTPQKKEKSINQFLEQTKNIYVAYNSANTHSTSSFQAVLVGKYSYLTPKFAFTKKNGFSKINITNTDGKNYTFWNNSNASIQTAFPQSGLILAASSSVIKLQERFINFQNASKSVITEKLDFIHNPAAIKIYVTSPGKLIPQILGTTAIELAINDAIIYLTPVKDNDKMYNLTLNLGMSSTRSQSLGLILLTIAEKKQQFKFEKLNENNILITDYFVSIHDIENMLD